MNFFVVKPLPIESIADCENLTGLQHCSARAMTYVHGVAETDWASLRWKS